MLGFLHEISYPYFPLLKNGYIKKVDEAIPLGIEICHTEILVCAGNINPCLCPVVRKKQCASQIPAP